MRPVEKNRERHRGILTESEKGDVRALRSINPSELSQFIIFKSSTYSI